MNNIISNFILDMSKMDFLEKEINEKINNLLEKDINIFFQNAGVLVFTYKDYDIKITIWVNENKNILEQYHIDDEYLWNYLNSIFLKYPKSITFKNKKEKNNIQKLTLNEKTINQINVILNNEEYNLLKEKYNLK